MLILSSDRQSLLLPWWNDTGPRSCEKIQLFVIIVKRKQLILFIIYVRDINELRNIKTVFFKNL